MTTNLPQSVLDAVDAFRDAIREEYSIVIPKGCEDFKELEAAELRVVRKHASLLTEIAARVPVPLPPQSCRMLLGGEHDTDAEVKERQKDDAALKKELDLYKRAVAHYETSAGELELCLEQFEVHCIDWARAKILDQLVQEKEYADKAMAVRRKILAAFCPPMKQPTPEKRDE